MNHPFFWGGVCNGFNNVEPFPDECCTFSWSFFKRSLLGSEIVQWNRPNAITTQHKSSDHHAVDLAANRPISDLSKHIWNSKWCHSIIGSSISESWAFPKKYINPKFTAQYHINIIILFPTKTNIGGFNHHWCHPIDTRFTAAAGDLKQHPALRTSEEDRAKHVPCSPPQPSQHRLRHGAPSRSEKRCERRIPRDVSWFRLKKHIVNILL